MADENNNNDTQEKSDTQKAIEQAVAKLKTNVDTVADLAKEGLQAAEKIQKQIKEILEFKQKAIKLAADMIKDMGTSMVEEISKMISGGGADLAGAMKKSLSSSLTKIAQEMPPKTPKEEPTQNNSGTSHG